MILLRDWLSAEKKITIFFSVTKAKAETRLGDAMIAEKLTAVTGVKPETLRGIAEDNTKFYRTYSIRKRSGGKRKICEPQELLKRIQTALIQLVFSKYPVSKYAAAYEKGCSIQKNAEQHKKANHLVHFDIRDFFPSITYLHVYQLLARRYSERDIDLIWKLCSYGSGLPIGAPSSPALCNRIFYSPDKKLRRAARGMCYTRYADDLIFSGKKYIKPAFEEKIDAILRDAGFSLAPEKTRFMGDSTRKKVTGLILTTDKKVSVGTDYKLRLKHDLYEYRARHQGKAAELSGRLAFLASVEPEYAKRLKQKYRFPV